ncbi:zinc finger protein 2-like [Pseudomyrmex gracilis]|uniref:zinc finger protein 2-like n=1 Tax=Pseudomyrmex gracilis TaxID=219809 RepID=UPI00099516AD|nr:zinc finger protein 2-like [Pseudomyrmex gracilis]
MESSSKIYPTKFPLHMKPLKRNRSLLASLLLTQDNNDLSWNQQQFDESSTYKMPSVSRKKNTGGGDIRMYGCNRCGKSYKAATSLSRHKRLECGVVPCEVCPICSRRFKHKFVLNAHIGACERRMNQTIHKKVYD